MVEAPRGRETYLTCSFGGPPPYRSGGFMGSYWPPPGPIPLFILHHGICVEKLQLNQACPGLELYLDVEGLDFDLSTLRVLRDERFEARLHWLLKDLETTHSLFLEYSQEAGAPVPWTTRVGVLSTTGGLFGLLLGGPGGGLVGTCLGAAGATLLSGLTYGASNTNTAARSVILRLNRLRHPVKID